MSDFLANLVRRGAGLAPIVRSRPAPSPGPAEDVAVGVESEPQSAAQPVAVTPVITAAGPQPVAAAPHADIRPSPVALSAAIAPPGVVQRAPDTTAAAATPAPASPPGPPVSIVPADRTTAMPTPAEAAPHSHVASTRPVAAPPTTVRVIEGSRGPSERIVDIRREVISVSTPVTSAVVAAHVTDETPPIVAAPSSPEAPSIEAHSAPPIDHEPVIAEVPRARPVTPTEAVVIVRQRPSVEPVRDAPAAPLGHDIAIAPRGEEPTPVMPAELVAIPVRVAAPLDRPLEEPATALARSVPIVDLRTETTPAVERVVELPSAAETVRPRPTRELVPAPASATIPAPAEASMPERIVHVRIGAVEIHAAPSAEMQAAPGAPVAVAQPSAGFDEFVRLRTYEPWQW